MKYQQIDNFDTLLRDLITESEGYRSIVYNDNLRGQGFPTIGYGCVSCPKGRRENL